MDSLEKKYKAIFISPHLDDAVFSCAAEIHRLSQQGPVLVLNIFSRYLAGIKKYGVVLGEERYTEEQNAAQFLNFETHYLDELDASVRNEHYKSLGNIFRPPARSDKAWLAELREKLFSTLSQLKFEKLYLPLGIGWHVDHILTYSAFELWPASTNVFFYEDTPYCLFPHATRLRMAEIGCPQVTVGDRSMQMQSLWTSWKETMCIYSQTALMKNLRPWILQKIASPVVHFYLHRLMSFHQNLSGSVSNIQWIPEIRVLSDSELDYKVNAIFCYRSQAREFFLDQNDCKHLLIRYAQTVDPQTKALERFWCRHSRHSM